MMTAIQSSWCCRKTALWVPVLLVVSAFAIAVSSTAKSILVPLALMLIVFMPAYRQALIATLYQPWCQASICLFLIALVACCWSPASHHEKMLVVEKYSKLVYLPILAVGFRDQKTRRYALYAFLLAMLLTCLISLLKDAGLIKYHGDDPGNVFHTHIITGYMMVFATYLAATFMMEQRGRMRLVYAFLVGLFSYQIFFVSLGRTAYIIYALLMVLFLLQMLSWRQALFAILFGGSVFVGLYSQSTTMQVGVKQAIVDWHAYYQNNKDTPIGHRLQFHEYAKNLYLRHPWIGNGTGSFTHLFEKEKPVKSWRVVLLEPHSQYWLVAAEFGLIGVLALLFFLSSLLLASVRLQSMRPVAIAMLVPFIIGNLSDSLLFYSGSGYFFILFMALCLGEQSSWSNKTHS